jgi:hypothetical protein
MKPVNIKEAKGLAMHYQTITLREVTDAYKHSSSTLYIANSLTGYGFSDTCKLCQVVKDRNGDAVCVNCIYQGHNECLHDDNRETFMNISEATNPKELVAAFRARAKHIKAILKQLEADDHS